jgi:hypothetical protein
VRAARELMDVEVSELSVPGSASGPRYVCGVTTRRGDALVESPGLERGGGTRGPGRSSCRFRRSAKAALVPRRHLQRRLTSRTGRIAAEQAQADRWQNQAVVQVDEAMEALDDAPTLLCQPGRGLGASRSGSAQAAQSGDVLAHPDPGRYRRVQLEGVPHEVYTLMVGTARARGRQTFCVSVAGEV